MLRTAMVCALLFASSAGFSISTAMAHNAAGHKIIAEIAWQKLTPLQRQAIATILREHPRFDEDFESKMPPNISGGSQAEQDHWIFCQAAIWPDIIKSVSGPDNAAYNRPVWHYINLPVFLSAAQASSLQDGLTVNTHFNPADTADERKYNGAQAVKHNLAIISNASSTNSDKAVAYCWILHVIPDLAQPLHSSALFTEELFPSGDQGGNKIKIRRQGNSGAGQKLHAVWDGLLGSNSGFTEIRAKAQQLIADHNTEFAAAAGSMPNDVWVTESHTIAKVAAYGPLIADLQDAEDDGGSLGVIEVSSSYFSDSGAVMSERAVIAGVRLASVLSSTTSSPGGGANPLGLAIGGRNRARIALEGAKRKGAATDSDSVDLRDLASRMARIESELTQIRVLLERSSRLENSPRDKAKMKRLGLRLDAATEDDGEQCDCGAGE